MDLDLLDRFSKNTQISKFLKPRTLGAELFHADGQTDGKTDRHDEANSRFLQFSESAYKKKTIYFPAMGSAHQLALCQNCYLLVSYNRENRRLSNPHKSSPY